MKHSYQITGMSCNGCRTSVEKALNTIDGIDASVTLDPPVATVTMEKHIPIEKLQEALSVAGNYSISVENSTNSTSEKVIEPVKKSCC